MLSAQRIVINTAPILAIVAALGDLSVFQLYQEVLVPLEVGQEIFAGGSDGFAIAEFEAATWLNKQNEPLTIPLLLVKLCRSRRSCRHSISIKQRHSDSLH